MSKKQLVIGLGNPILGDDRVGWAVVEEVERRKHGDDVDFAYLSFGGIRLMEHLVGYDSALIVDAIVTTDGIPGEVYSFPLVELPDPSAGHTTSAHDTSLVTALKMGQLMDISVPDPKDVFVIAIESQEVHDFSENLTPKVRAAIPLAVQKVLDYLEQESEE